MRKYGHKGTPKRTPNLYNSLLSFTMEPHGVPGPILGPILIGFWVDVGPFSVFFEAYFAFIMYSLYVCFVSVVGDGV